MAEQIQSRASQIIDVYITHYFSIELFHKNYNSLLHKNYTYFNQGQLL